MRHKDTVAHLDVNRHGRSFETLSFRNVNLLGEQRLTGALFRDGSQLMKDSSIRPVRKRHSNGRYQCFRLLLSILFI